MHNWSSIAFFFAMMINITVAAFYPYQSQYEALGELEREMNAVQPSVVDTFRTWRKYMFVLYIVILATDSVLTSIYGS